MSKYGVFSGLYFPEFGLMRENVGKYSPEKTPYLDIFHGVSDIVNGSDNAKYLRERYAVLKQVLEHFIKRFFKEYVNSLHE